MKKCERCGLKTEHPRRGMCLKCYRITTNLSGGDQIIRNLKKELIKIKQRILLIEQGLKSISKERRN